MYETLIAAETSVCEPAEVLAVTSSGVVRLRLASSDHEAHATLAIATRVAPGDRVLAIGKDLDALFVIGVLGQTAQRVTARSGAYAEVGGSPESETLRVYSSHGDLLVEVDPTTNLARVTVPTADLHLSAPQGDVQVAAGRTLRLAAGAIDLRAVQSVQARAGGFAADQQPATLAVDSSGVRLEGKQLQLQAQRGQANIDELHYSGKTCRFAAKAVRMAVDSLETVAETVMQTARNVYSTVKQLAQLRAGRIRQRAEETCHVKAGQMYLHAEAEVKVQGEKIHLG